MAGKVVNLAVGLSSFAQYDFTCGRGYAFSESYLVKPASEILAALYPGKTVLTEMKHPTLLRSGRGDHPRVDVAVLDEVAPGRRRWEGMPLAVLELKWCGDSVPSPSFVLWDLVRLASISYHHPKVDCYFALVGIRSKIDAFFLDISKTRTRNNSTGPFLRSQPDGEFGVLKCRQLDCELQSDISARLGGYKAGAFDVRVGFKQLDTVRHDAGPAEPRATMKPRIGVSAIVSRIAVGDRPK
ncbi:hypothetical protein [Sorangium sp. So ce176]|uniref:hypothetical protein n=1 Tax=Sorangium sp. So ce176 TaxID=3133286 RepID=UPI003F606D13